MEIKAQTIRSMRDLRLVGRCCVRYRELVSERYRTACTPRSTRDEVFDLDQFIGRSTTVHCARNSGTCRGRVSTDRNCRTIVGSSLTILRRRSTAMLADHSVLTDGEKTMIRTPLLFVRIGSGFRCTSNVVRADTSAGRHDYSSS
jgi:hypothetical protein